MTKVKYPPEEIDRIIQEEIDRIDEANHEEAAIERRRRWRATPLGRLLSRVAGLFRGRSRY